MVLLSIQKELSLSVMRKRANVSCVDCCVGVVSPGRVLVLVKMMPVNDNPSKAASLLREAVNLLLGGQKSEGNQDTASSTVDL